jgi:biotin carboxyl carrier protein
MTGSDKPYKIKANDHLFYFDETEAANADVISVSPTEYNCIRDHWSVNAVMIEADTDNKRFKVAIEGEVFLVEIKDELDQMLESMGFGLAATKLITDIKAPMPGLVFEIGVTEGQLVNAGDKILILEAMKMENSITAIANATIKKILVSKGQAVDRGQVLVELGPV